MQEQDEDWASLRFAGHAVLLMLVLWYSWTYVVEAQPQTLLHMFILPFHEAGHFVLALLGGSDFVVQLAGSGAQVLLPLAFCVHFVWRSDYFAAWFALWLLGENLVDISVYMRDAKVMLLPMFGGDAEHPELGHDWNNLFGSLGVLHKAIIIADRTRLVGWLVMLLAVGGMAWCLVEAWHARHRDGGQR